MLSVANDAMKQSFAAAKFRQCRQGRRRPGSAACAKRRAQQRF
jgi:hypothetical protein